MVIPVDFICLTIFMVLAAMCCIIALYGFISIIDKNASVYTRQQGYGQFTAGVITTLVCIYAIIRLVG